MGLENGISGVPSGPKILPCLRDTNSRKHGLPPYLRMAAGVDLRAPVCREVVKNVGHVPKHV